MTPSDVGADGEGGAAAAAAAAAAAGADGGKKRTFIDYAISGEKYNQRGDKKKAIPFFLKAIKMGTTDIQALSAVHSQVCY